MGRALPFAPLLITDVHPQEIQRHFPLALPFRVRDDREGVIVAGAQPVGQCQIMGEQRPANDRRHVLAQR